MYEQVVFTLFIRKTATIYCTEHFEHQRGDHRVVYFLASTFQALAAYSHSLPSTSEHTLSYNRSSDLIALIYHNCSASY
jgi:hypothetical protein